MRKVKLSQLEEAVRGFLDGALQEDGLIVEDDAGRLRGQFVPYRDPTPEEERRADESLERLRQKTGESMQRHGVTEDDIMRELLTDD